MKLFTFWGELSGSFSSSESHNYGQHIQSEFHKMVGRWWSTDVVTEFCSTCQKFRISFFLLHKKKNCPFNSSASTLVSGQCSKCYGVFSRLSIYSKITPASESFRDYVTCIMVINKGLENHGFLSSRSDWYMFDRVTDQNRVFSVTIYQTSGRTSEQVKLNLPALYWWYFDGDCWATITPNRFTCR